MSNALAAHKRVVANCGELMVLDADPADTLAEDLNISRPAVISTMLSPQASYSSATGPPGLSAANQNKAMCDCRATSRARDMIGEVMKILFRGLQGGRRLCSGSTTGNQVHCTPRSQARTLHRPRSISAVQHSAFLECLTWQHPRAAEAVSSQTPHNIAGRWPTGSNLAPCAGRGASCAAGG
jgi:hypothetical protein